ncbi:MULTISPECIES: hypothetical protein [Shewanella]|uniref:hypothetical protein n=1 Tax=Shewanella TaxID=22 RepID=UPI000849AF7D|nr:hypothetical protein [Shewanella xiamenensis]MCT8865543.1 hypothetical protein [Shewanella xiamenensis]MCT8868982.1 hypothetical protein [Shewanella xiamenensis]MCT8873667.1 hypothetical protein [Shewanella xiamenensis]MCT8878394.1 hypothetical protein [Shewanella xiamenensis]ODR83644.1 hypothetical protein ABT47_22960 [Shewanella xiamenensis]
MINWIIASATLVVFQSPLGLPAGLKVNDSSLQLSHQMKSYFENTYPKPKPTKQQLYIDNLYRKQMEAMPTNTLVFNSRFQIPKNDTIGKILVTFNNGMKPAYVGLDHYYRFNEGKE